MIAQDQIDTINKLKDKITNAESKLEYAKGKLSAKKEELKEKFKINSIEEAEEVLDTLEVDINKTEKKIIEILNKLKEDEEGSI